MSIINDAHGLTRLPAISDQEKKRICDFLQGAVYSWCKNSKEPKFHCRDLIGGDNSDWNGTPLQVMYEYRCNYGSKNPVKSAGKDAGWFLKKVLHEDSRKFRSFAGANAKCYKWITS